MNNQETPKNKDALTSGKIGADSKEPVSDIISTEKSEGVISKDAFDALDELSSEMQKKESTADSRDEYLSRFRTYEESITLNERVPTGGRIENNTKKTMSKPAKFLRTLVLIISVGAFLISGSMIVERAIKHYNTRKGDSQINDLTISDGELLSMNVSDEDFLRTLMSKYPHLKDVEFPAGFNYKYALLYAANRDFVGYLTIPNTRINTAVLQHSDDDYYYDHDFYGKTSNYGAVFAQTKHNMVKLDMNTVLVGHHMKDGTRFHDLKYYQTQDGYKKSPVIEFNTIYDNYKWKVYGAMIVNASLKDDNDYRLNYMFNNISQQSFAKYIDEIEKRTLYKTGVDLLPTDKILTLVTCTYEFDNARLVVIARMVREGESEEVDLSLVSNKSTAIKYPQALYDKRGKSNPYINDEKWYPNQ